MTEKKPWYLSRTIWASLTTIAAAAAGHFGLPVEAADEAVLTDALLQAVAAISGILAVVGRVLAKSRIGGSGPR